MRQVLNQAAERRSCSPPRMVMVPRGSQSSLMRRGRPITAVSGYQLLMLDGPSTGTDDPVVCGVLRSYVQRLRTSYSVTVK